ncbi:hypothetical protein F4802DRAFT_598092 [Xylaria palmicola]|nr:hypothetical protein F4802DRAFT_598092 [Xylaria palmicola]
MDLPTIILDTTLTDLYRRASPKIADKHIAQVMCPVNSAIQLTRDIPRNVKYLYQDSAFNESSREDGILDLSTQTKRELAISYVALAPQRDAFLSGDSTVVLFELGDGDAQRSHNQDEARKTMSVLPDKQQLNLVFCSGLSDILVEEENIDLMAYKLSADGLEGYDLLTPLETSWITNAKGALAESGLLIPKCDVIEIEGLACETKLCCDVCRGQLDSFLIPINCAGQRGRWYCDQSARIYQQLLARPLPFVFKNQQAYGGAGTYLIRDEQDRENLVGDLRNGILRRMLSYVTESNRHLQSAAIILSELIENPTTTWGLSFFVTEHEPIFLAVTELILLEGRYYIGSVVHYDRQDELKRKFQILVEDISSWLRGCGYIGPVGVDVLETSKPAQNPQTRTGADGEIREHSKFHILDINARTSGQLCLPLLRSHFTGHGLDCAATFFLRVLKRREEFIAMFEDEFKIGKICILSWYDDPESDVSFGNVVVGSKDIDELMRDMKRIRDVSQEVTF